MVTGNLIAQQYTTTYHVMMRLTSDITHEESLRQ